MQMTHDPAPEKPGPAKHSNNLHHGKPPFVVEKSLLRASFLAYTSGLRCALSESEEATTAEYAGAWLD